jgi:hypothetical protein
MGKMFQNASSLKPLGQLKPNCPGMIIGRSSVFYADRKSKMAAKKKVIMVCDTPPYGHAHTYQISLTYLERQKCYGPDKQNTIKKKHYLTLKADP